MNLLDNITDEQKQKITEFLKIPSIQKFLEANKLNNVYAYCSANIRPTLTKMLYYSGVKIFENLEGYYIPTNFLTNVSAEFSVDYLPKAIVCINAMGFYACNMTSFNFNYIENIGKSSFSATNLKDVSLPNIESIDNSAFSNCYYLTSIHLGPNLKYLGANVFGFSKELKEIYYDSTINDFKKLYSDSDKECLNNSFIETIFCTDGEITTIHKLEPQNMRYYIRI